MTPELTVLALGILLQGAYFAAYGYYGFVRERQVGLRWALSPRDTPRQTTGRTARAQRAEANYVQGLVLYGLAALLVAASGQSTGVTAACAWLWLLARVAYLPAYLYGWVPWRSLVWGVSYLASLLMALAALI